MSKIIGYVAYQVGEVLANNGEGNDRVLLSHSLIEVSDVIRSINGGTALIVLFNGEKITLAPGETLFIDEVIGNIQEDINYSNISVDNLPKEIIEKLENNGSLEAPQAGEMTTMSLETTTFISHNENIGNANSINITPNGSIEYNYNEPKIIDVTTAKALTINATQVTPTSDIIDASDTGISNSDNITRDTTPTITGTAEAGATITIKLSDGTVVGTTTVESNGVYSVTTSTLLDGTQDLIIEAKGLDGNTATTTQNITIDTSGTAGTVTVNSITADDVINATEANQTITVSGSATGGDIKTGDSVTATINGTNYSTIVNGDGTYSFSVAGADLVADTEFTVNISSSDSAGNSVTSSTTSTHSVDIQSVASLAIIDGNGVLEEAEIANVTITGQVEVGGSISSFTITDGSTTLTIDPATVVINGDGTWSTTQNLSSLADGNIIVSIVALDIYSNSVTKTQSIEKDTSGENSGNLVDSLVDGVEFTTTSGVKGFTTDGGKFTYNDGDIITFKIGGVVLGTVDTDNIHTISDTENYLFLQDLAGVAIDDFNDETVENLAMLLQSLDSDSNPNNNITIDSTILENLKNTNLSVEDLNEAQIAEIIKVAVGEFTFDAQSAKAMQSQMITHASDTMDSLVSNVTSDLTPFDWMNPSNFSQSMQNAMNIKELLQDKIDAGTLHLDDTTDAHGIDLGWMLEGDSITFSQADLLVNSNAVHGYQTDLTVSNVNVDAQYGIIVNNGDGTYTFTASQIMSNLNNININFTVNDWTASATVNAIIDIRNKVVAVDDVNAVNEDATVSKITLNGILSNDSNFGETTVTSIRAGGEDTFGVGGTVGSAFEGLYGTLTLNSNGSYTYVVNQNVADRLSYGETATESFTYTVTDGYSSDTADLTFTITGTNDAPIAKATSGGSLLGLVSAEIITIDALASKQAMLVYDIDKDIKSVKITWSTLVSVHLTATPLSLSQAVANELGLTLSENYNPGLLGLLAPSYSVTITANDGGIIDNNTMNELLGTLEYSSEIIGLGIATLTSLTVIDERGASTTESYGDLAALTLLTTNSANIVEGTTGNNTMNGTANNDIINGLSGDDIINANGGDDLVYGDSGKDTISGGDGNDIIFGGLGDDTIYGDAGDDFLFAEDGADIVFGGGGNDTIYGGLTDTISGGTDTLTTNEDINSIDTFILTEGGEINLDKIYHIETIDLSDSNAQTILNITTEDIFNTSDTNELYVLGDVNDFVSIDASLQLVGGTSVDGHNYTQYSGQYSGTEVKIYIEEKVYIDS